MGTGFGTSNAHFMAVFVEMLSGFPAVSAGNPDSWGCPDFEVEQRG